MLSLLVHAMMDMLHNNDISTETHAPIYGQHNEMVLAELTGAGANPTLQKNSKFRLTTSQVGRGPRGAAPP